MNKKTMLQEELNEAVKREATSEDCPDVHCKQHFGNCDLLRDAHKQRYPDHFSGQETKGSDKEEAILVDLKAKRSNRK